ncbi:hypothetical protein NC653_010029 [Populus alba x Populus x berolinensis]|uniref:Uncharacterized protein n=1 Tax=Populus alba x Populus x berolinensis TaxID=444605 RepID=A0AAD6WB65_9ROSI|nr:hypothetical protein NC653_010029 [Populus alba x Populus x berolinensis]
MLSQALTKPYDSKGPGPDGIFPASGRGRWGLSWNLPENLILRIQVERDRKFRERVYAVKDRNAQKTKPGSWSEEDLLMRTLLQDSYELPQVNEFTQVYDPANNSGAWKLSTSAFLDIPAILLLFLRGRWQSDRISNHEGRFRRMFISLFHHAVKPALQHLFTMEQNILRTESEGTYAFS